jgi:hypothetical protein
MRPARSSRRRHTSSSGASGSATKTVHGAARAPLATRYAQYRRVYLTHAEGPRSLGTPSRRAHGTCRRTSRMYLVSIELSDAASTKGGSHRARAQPRRRVGACLRLVAATRATLAALAVVCALGPRRRVLRHREVDHFFEFSLRLLAENSKRKRNSIFLSRYLATKTLD